MNSLADFWQRTDGIFIALGVALLVFAAFFLLSKLLYCKIFPALQNPKNKKQHPVLEELLTGFRKPLSVYLQLAGFCFALLSLSNGLQSEVIPWSVAGINDHLPAILNRVLRIGTVVAVAWGFVASSDITSQLLRNARHRLDLHTSKSVTRFLAAVFNVVVVAIAVVIILSELNYDINGLIAGLGLGGLTVALAAKDSAANFFGGLVLVMEKPFEIGDWINCTDVEGTVEDINLRSTKVRTSAGSLTTVPNSVLSGAPITNWSGAMEKRRADFALNVVCGTARQQLQHFAGDAQQMLEDDKDILSDSIVVRFSDISQSSLDIRIIFYTALPGFSDHLAIKERVNYALLDLAQKHGVEFAFPTRTVYLEKGRDSAPLRDTSL